MRLKEKIRRSKLASRGYDRRAINVLCRRRRARLATTVMDLLHAVCDTPMRIAAYSSSSSPWDIFTVRT